MGESDFARGSISPTSDNGDVAGGVMGRAKGARNMRRGIAVPKGMDFGDVNDFFRGRAG